jgi:hypothetical protein
MSARVHGARGVGGRIAVLEDGHEPVAGGLVDITARVGDAVEEAPEVALDERVQVGGRDALGEPAASR